MVHSLFFKKMPAYQCYFGQMVHSLFFKKNACIPMLFRADAAFAFFLKKCLHTNAISGRWCIRFF